MDLARANTQTRRRPCALPNPALDSQATFRILLEAMGSPGEVRPLPCVVPSIPGLHGSLLQVLLTLADYETPVWVSPDLASEDLMRFLRLGPGCPIALDAGKASFAVAAIDEPLPSLQQFAQGTPLYPDQSTTLLLCCRMLSMEGADRVMLRGPGVPLDENGKSGRSFGVGGGTQQFWDQVAVNHAQYPLGVDIVFMAPHAVAALPRSTAVEWIG